MDKEVFKALGAIEYFKHSAAKVYYIGFIYRDKVFGIEVQPTTLAAMLKISRASRNQGWALRLSIKAQLKVELAKTADWLCSKEELMTICKAKGLNKGEAFEALLGGGRNNTPFDQGGDVIWNGKLVQLKFERATLITERGLLRIRG